LPDSTAAVATAQGHRRTTESRGSRTVTLPLTGWPGSSQLAAWVDVAAALPEARQVALARLWRCSTVQPPGTCWMWRRCRSVHAGPALRAGRREGRRFRPRCFADALAAAAAHSDAAFAELGLGPEAVAAVRTGSAQLLNAGGVSTSAAGRSFSTPMLGPMRPGAVSRMVSRTSPATILQRRSGPSSPSL
jgi:hypothetical protein